MYDEVMQLIALAKNDEQYFKRIDELKQKQLELAQVMEIAKTVGEADLYLAGARQKADQILADAETEAKAIKDAATAVVAETKATLEKAKAKKSLLATQEDELKVKLDALKAKESEMDRSIKEHREYTALRTVEMEAAQKVKVEFTDKLRKLKEIANQ